MLSEVIYRYLTFCSNSLFAVLGIVKIKVGIAARITNNSAYGAASLNLLIAAKLQISVAKVSIPVGLNIKVAGSSFIAVRKTKSTPRARFGRAIGKTTSRAILDLLLPKVAATSLNCGDTRANASEVDATDFARKRTA
jgi:hypothetical protein